MPGTARSARELSEGACHLNCPECLRDEQLLAISTFTAKASLNTSKPSKIQASRNTGLQKKASQEVCQKPKIQGTRDPLPYSPVWHWVEGKEQDAKLRVTH